MAIKRVVVVVLLGFVVVSVVFLFAKEAGRDSLVENGEQKDGATATAPGNSAASSPSSQSSRQLTVYYFCTTARCVSCRTIEALTKEAVSTGFADATGEGRLEFRVINTDMAENRHYIEDYQLYTKSVVVSEVMGGKEVRWKNLSRVWELLGDREAFIGYVTREIDDYLGGD